MLNAIYGLSDGGLLGGVSWHSGDVKFIPEVIDDGTPILVDNPAIPIPESIRQFNTSPLARMISIDPDSRENFNDAFSCTGNPTSLSLFTMLNDNGDHLIPVIVGYSGRLMNSNVGPDVGFSHGVGLMLPDEDLWPAKVKDILTYLTGKYSGELTFDIDEHWDISSVRFGHQPHYLSLLSEFYGMRYGDLLDWLVNEEDIPRYSTGITISVLVSKPPYPFIAAPQTDGIQAANEAEKHIWRMIIGRCEVALVSAHSDCIPKGRRRLFRTINRMRRYDDFIQYRTDSGWKLDFLKMNAVYEEYCNETRSE
jgi:hypothetical protein